MQKTIFLFLVAALVCGFQEEKLKKVQLSKAVATSLPESLRAMTDDEIARRFYTYRKPLASFTTTDLTVNFSFNEAVTPWRKEDTELLRNMYRASIPQLYSKVDFMQQDIKTINNRSFAVFEFTSEIREENKESMNYGKVTRGYDYIQYTVENGKVLIFHFSCPFLLKDKWQATARAIMQTVRIK